MSLPKSSFSWFGIGSVTLILAIALIFPYYKGAGNVIFGIIGGLSIVTSAYSWYTFVKLRKKEKEESTPYN
jgi:hypothetical protein